jgi:protein-tyrosine-phosphatase
MNQKMRIALACPVFGIALLLTAPSLAGDEAANKTIVFVCLHGSVKSQMAAAHFNKIAKERGLPYTAVSRGIEVDTSIPTRIRDGLSLDGLAPLDDVPKPLTPDEAATAVKVVAFDTVPDDKRGSAEVNYWSDVPPATRDYAAARDAIMHHIDTLVPALAQPSHPQETLQGIITVVDERNDQIRVWLDSDVSNNFKVQDGLIFNSVKSGERVEITVETLAGAKTIVGLKKL